MSMNLLPWRIYQYQKRLRRLAFYVALFILLAINLMLAFSNLIEQQKQNLQTRQKYFEQLNQKRGEKSPHLITIKKLNRAHKKADSAIFRKE